MTEPAYYYLSEVEEMFRLSRDSLTRWAKAGIFDVQGENRGRRVSGSSARKALARLEAGEDLWAVVKAHESARSGVKPTAKARSTKTTKATGGINPPQKTASDSPDNVTLMSNPQSWVKPIT